MTEIRRYLLAMLPFLLSLPVVAQEKSDTAYTFHFMPGDDMFYVSFKTNEVELARLESCVEKYKAEIAAGNMPLRVDGYCSTTGNDRLAKIRSNRVKSELIERQHLTEDCFVTRNHSGSGDYVTVRFSIPLRSNVEDVERETPVTPPEEADELEPEETIMANDDKPESRQPVTNEQAQDEETVLEHPAVSDGASEDYRFAFRANLLRWATLTPDLGLEWRIGRSWGVMLHGSWTSWSWNGKDRRYALWEVSPEVRCYLGKGKRGYLGGMYKAGQFNYKFSSMGKLGDLTGGGITGGYRLLLNDVLSMDFTLAAGCLHVDYERYEVVDGIRVRKSKDSKNWWGPVNAGVTLVWTIK